LTSAALFGAPWIVAGGEVPGWPADVREVRHQSSGDKTMQPALFWSPAGLTEKRPLLVGLHTWSADYRQTGSSLPYLLWCKQQGWIFVHPNFRGPNRTAVALGSDLAVADVASAVEYAKSQAPVDDRRIYLIGASGGGHMALLMAGRHPEIWAGVSAWCPIADVNAWHRECTENPRFGGYARHIESALGGPPDADPTRAASAAHRSPSKWLHRAKDVPLDIGTGVHDGRTGSVPFRHTLQAFNAVAAPGDRLAPADIESYYATERLPAGWSPAGADLLYGKKKPLFRWISGNTRVTIFEGGHEIVHVAGLNWLAQQRKGQPAVWDIKDPVQLKIPAEATRSGK
jgi:pimeloyl-ACP methyl ester carboxylesterase